MTKSEYERRKANGICPQCGKPAATGFVSCPDCLCKDAIRASKRTKAYKRKVSQAHIKRNRDNGKCLSCGKPAATNRVRCEKCLLKARLRQRASYIYHPRPDGICRMCDKPVKQGYHYCDEHYLIMVEKAAHMREVNRGFDMKYIFR